MKKTIVFFLIISLSASPVFAEDWINKWIDQKTYSGPNYFKTGGRGYGSLGSYSARWQSQTLKPFTISKPRFEVGCGGIDLFLGGFSFLQFDLLVKKMRKIMGPAAAAYAFDLALGTLSAQAQKSLGKLMAVVDKLNNMQFDECNAGKALVATVADTVAPKGKGAAKTAALSGFMQESGVNDLWNSIGDLGKGGSADAAADASGTSAMDAVSGCPTDLKDIFFTSGSMLSHIGGKNNLDSDQIDLIRGLIGDVNIDSSLNYVPVDQCPQNNTKLLDSVINGTIQKKTAAGDCEDAGEITVSGVVYTNMKDWIQTEIQNIGGNMLAKTALTPEQQGLLSQIPPPILTVLESKIAYSGGDANEAILQTSVEYADYTASLFAYNMLGDIYGGLEDTLGMAVAVRNTQAGAAVAANNVNCKLELSEAGFKNIKIQQKKVIKLMTAMHSEFEGKVSSVMANINISQTVNKRAKVFDAAVKKTLHNVVKGS